MDRSCPTGFGTYPRLGPIIPGGAGRYGPVSIAPDESDFRSGTAGRCTPGLNRPGLWDCLDCRDAFSHFDHIKELMPGMSPTAQDHNGLFVSQIVVADIVIALGKAQVVLQEF